MPPSQLLVKVEARMEHAALPHMRGSRDLKSYSVPISTGSNEEDDGALGGGAIFGICFAIFVLLSICSAFLKTYTSDETDPSGAFTAPHPEPQAVPDLQNVMWIDGKIPCRYKAELTRKAVEENEIKEIYKRITLQDEMRVCFAVKIQGLSRGVIAADLRNIITGPLSYTAIEVILTRLVQDKKFEDDPDCPFVVTFTDKSGIYDDGVRMFTITTKDNTTPLVKSPPGTSRTLPKQEQEPIRKEESKQQDPTPRLLKSKLTTAKALDENEIKEIYKTITPEEEKRVAEAVLHYVKHMEYIGRKDWSFLARHLRITQQPMLNSLSCTTIEAILTRFAHDKRLQNDPDYPVYIVFTDKSVIYGPGAREFIVTRNDEKYVKALFPKGAFMPYGLLSVVVRFSLTL
jgi:hypothetical protein